MLLKACLVLALAVGSYGQWCPGNQYWSDCGSPCTEVCWDRNPVCIEVCEAKCECPSGTYWHSMDQMCYGGEECDARGLFEGSSPPQWAYMTTRMPTTTGGYCNWCLYDICDEMSTCTYGWKVGSTTPSYPDGGGSGSGNCERCISGYCDYSGKCEYGCQNGYYGWDCSMECSSNCMYRECDRDGGFCTSGCVNGTEGAFCEDWCPQGCNEGWGCDLSQDYWSCEYNATCFQCGCQGLACVDGGGWHSSAAITTTPLLGLTLLALVAALIRA